MSDEKPLSRDAKQDLTDRLVDIIKRTRDNRTTLEEKWLSNHAIWKGVKRGETYQGRFDYYIPIARRQIERLVTRIVAQLFPAEDRFEVAPGDEFDLANEEQAAAARHYMSWLLSPNGMIPARRLANQLVRSFLLYTRGIFKSSVRSIDVPVEEGTMRGRIRQIWPITRAVDPFSFYVWPETALGVEDAIIAFEDVMMPWDEYQTAVERGVADSIDRSDLSTPVWPYHHTERLGQAGFSDPNEPGPDGEGRKAEQAFVQLTEAWPRIGGRWLQVWIVWNIKGAPLITRLQRSKYPRPPYRMAVSREIPNEHYTTGSMDDLRELQLLLNNQFNESEDQREIAGEPPIAVDPGRVGRTDDLVYEARKKWRVPPDAVQPIAVPDTSASSLRAMQNTLILMQQIGDSPILQGQPVRGMPRGSAAVASLVSLAAADITDVARTIEDDVLSPWLSDLFRLTIGFVPRRQMIQLPSMENFPTPSTITVDQLFGNWVFRWLGSLQVQDRQEAARQALAFFGQLKELAPQLSAQGWEVDWGMMAKLFGRDLLGTKRLDKLIVRVPPPPPEPGPQPVPQLPPQPVAVPPAGVPAPGEF